MVKRRLSVSERVLQKRLTSAPPKPKDSAKEGGAAPPEPLHVAPLAPPPVFEEAPSTLPVVAPPPAEPAAPPPVAAAVVAPVEAPAPPKVEAPAPVKAEVAAPPKADVEKAPLAREPEPAPPAPSSVKTAEIERSIAPVSSSAPRTLVEPAAVEEPPESLGLAPERPSRWKLWTAAVAAFAAVVGIGIGVKIMRARQARARAQAAQAAQLLAARTEPAAPTPPPPPPPEPTAAVTAEPAATTVATAEPAPSAAASAAPSGSAAAAADDATASAKALRDEALILLKKYKNSEAIAKASLALDKDPTDAMPYLVLGSALQDNNRWREARRAYELCVKNATRGMVDECRAMLRRR